MNPLRRMRYSWLFSLLLMCTALFIIVAIVFYRSDAVQSIWLALIPPVLPVLEVRREDGRWLEQRWLRQNWQNEPQQVGARTRRYHHLSQGTRSLPIPYDWFLALEAASRSPLFLVAAEQPRFAENDHLLRMGFIRSPEHEQDNPDGLPIGFAKTASQILPGLKMRTEAIGFTCAACHTGHLVSGEGDDRLEYVIEGAGAVIDLGLLRRSLGAALAQTVLSEKLYPLGHTRFERFAERVLKRQNNASTRAALARQLNEVVVAMKEHGDTIQVREGFSRLDAFNRIGNKVFANNLNRADNYQPITSPVNYPHIWTSSWFNWVQYTGSIMQPLVRNVGEALGVGAYQEVSSVLAESRFDSSVAMDNIIWMEEWLAGREPSETEGFSGLLAPGWDFGGIDDDKLKAGRELYVVYCQHCHLPVLSDPLIWREQYFSSLHYHEGDEDKSTLMKLLQLKMISVDEIGTDAAVAKVLVERKVNTVAVESAVVAERRPALGLQQSLCRPRPVANLTDQLWLHRRDEKPFFTLTDGSNIGLGFALGAIVEQTIDTWYQRRGIDDRASRFKWSGGRPNCLQTKMQYKARPLNGVWATAPFLHNGSVATLRDLLCPIGGQRPRFVQLGGLAFDRENVGLLQPQDIDERGQRSLGSNSHYDDGLFILDTTIMGNHNTGHYFNSRYRVAKRYFEQPRGVIGPAFSERQCQAIIEYVKTL